MERATDPARGLFQGRRVARVYRSPTGMTVLVGLSAADNDIVSVKLGRPADFWFHVAGQGGAHVIALNPGNESRLDRETRDLAAGLAALHSGARLGGRVAVHMARCADVSKPRGAPPGRVAVRRFKSVEVRPTPPEVEEAARV